MEDEQELLVEIGLRIAKVVVASLIGVAIYAILTNLVGAPGIRAARARVVDCRRPRLPDPGDGHLLRPAADASGARRRRGRLTVLSEGPSIRFAAP